MPMLSGVRQRMSQYKIARKLGLSRSTAKRYLENPYFLESERREGRKQVIQKPDGS